MRATTWMAMGMVTLLAACGGDASEETSTSTTSSSSGGGGDACVALCTDSGFDGGKTDDYMNGLIECTCEGTNGAVTQDACSAYCSGFDVPADKSYLSENVIPNDKCVCDGSTPP